MQNKKSLNILILITVLLIIVFIGATLVLKYNMGKKDEIFFSDFTEKYYSNFIELDEKEKENINIELEKSYIEDDYRAGFSKYEVKQNIEEIYNKLIVAYQMNNEDLINDIKNIYIEETSKRKINLQTLSILDLVYYLKLSKLIDFSIDEEEVYNQVLKYYDESDNLFFINNENDNLADKIIITSKVVEALNDNALLQVDIVPQSIEKLEKIYFAYNFKNYTDESTLYNSGAEIIYALNKVKSEVTITNNHISWLNSWENNTININSMFEALRFIQFVEISNILGIEKSTHNLEKYLDTLVLDEEFDDFSFISDLNMLVELEKYRELSISVIDNLETRLSNFSLFKENIDIQNTFYGYILAKKSDFIIDEEKIKATIDEYYSVIKNLTQPDKLLHTLYYTVLMDKILNNGFLSVEKSLVIEKLEIFYSSELPISQTRLVIEIASSLAYDGKMHLKSSYIKKIHNNIREILYSDENYDYSEIVDAFITNAYLNNMKQTVSTSDFNKIKNSLGYKGGYKYKSTDETAYVSSTYYVMKIYYILEDLNFASNLFEENRTFVSSLKLKEGIYLETRINEEINLNTIYYGNAISKAKVHASKA